MELFNPTFKDMSKRGSGYGSDASPAPESKKGGRGRPKAAERGQHLLTMSILSFEFEWMQRSTLINRVTLVSRAPYAI